MIEKSTKILSVKRGLLKISTLEQAQWYAELVEELDFNDYAIRGHLDRYFLMLAQAMQKHKCTRIAGECYRLALRESLKIEVEDARLGICVKTTDPKAIFDRAMKFFEEIDSVEGKRFLVEIYNGRSSSEATQQ